MPPSFTRIRIVSYNAWLLPTAPWVHNRVNSVIDRLKHALTTGFELPTGDTDGREITVVALQEAWAWRVGLTWPLHYFLYLLQSFLFRFNLVHGGHEPILLRALILPPLFAMSLLQAYVPVLRQILWSPKQRIANGLSNTIPDENLKFAVTHSEPSFLQQSSWTFSPTLMDSGLLTIASISPDQSGFVAFPRSDNDEAVARKGMLWARWGDCVVINTHMTFVNKYQSRQRHKQTIQLAFLCASMLDPGPTVYCTNVDPHEPSLHGGGGPVEMKAPVSNVFIVGDLNTVFDSQTVDGDEHSVPVVNNGRGYKGRHSPNTYIAPWLSKHSALDRWKQIFVRVDPRMCVRRLSGDDPTCEDGTVDHVLCVSLGVSEHTYESVSCETYSDMHCECSDHSAIAVEAHLAPTVYGSKRWSHDSTDTTHPQYSMDTCRSHYPNNKCQPQY